MADDLQVKARALGDPTRHRIFRYLSNAESPVGVAELTDYFGLNHNAIRQHLAKLVDAGLVLESSAPPSGRGRPRLEYVVEPSTDSRWGVTGPYERLAVLLTEVVRSGDTPYEVGRRAALEDLRVHHHDDADPVGVLVDQMARQGFAPTVRDQADETVEVILGSCPFATAAMTDSRTICEMHRGMAEGVAEVVSGLQIDRLVNGDPREAQCRLTCSAGSADSGGGSDGGSDRGSGAAD